MPIVWGKYGIGESVPSLCMCMVLSRLRADSQLVPSTVRAIVCDSLTRQSTWWWWWHRCRGGSGIAGRNRCSAHCEPARLVRMVERALRKLWLQAVWWVLVSSRAISSIRGSLESTWFLPVLSVSTLIALKNDGGVARQEGVGSKLPLTTVREGGHDTENHKSVTSGASSVMYSLKFSRMWISLVCVLLFFLSISFRYLWGGSTCSKEICMWISTRDFCVYACLYWLRSSSKHPSLAKL